MMLCFGINPSTAKPGNLDKTLKSVERIVKRHKKQHDFDGWIMFNIYPQRATIPDKLHADIDKELHKRNLKEIEKAIKNQRGNIMILAAWGTLINKRKYLKDCLKDIYYLLGKYNCKWLCIGKQSKHGHPHHPLYLKNREMVKSFHIKK